jgi:hypothetical protein
MRKLVVAVLIVAALTVILFAYVVIGSVDTVAMVRDSEARVDEVLTSVDLATLQRVRGPSREHIPVGDVWLGWALEHTGPLGEIVQLSYDIGMRDTSEYWKTGFGIRDSALFRASGDRLETCKAIARAYATRPSDCGEIADSNVTLVAWLEPQPGVEGHALVARVSKTRAGVLVLPDQPRRDFHGVRSAGLVGAEPTTFVVLDLSA